MAFMSGFCSHTVEDNRQGFCEVLAKSLSVPEWTRLGKRGQFSTRVAEKVQTLKPKGLGVNPSSANCLLFYFQLNFLFWDSCKFYEVVRNDMEKSYGPFILMNSVSPTICFLTFDYLLNISHILLICKMRVIMVNTTWDCSEDHLE
jgi:hypothetical protein